MCVCVRARARVCVCLCLPALRLDGVQWRAILKNVINIRFTHKWEFPRKSERK